MLVPRLILARRRTLPRLRTFRLLLMPLLHLLGLLLVPLLHLLLPLLVEVSLLCLPVFFLLLLLQFLVLLVLLLNQLLLLLLVFLFFPRISGILRLLPLVWLQIARVRRWFRRACPVFRSRFIPAIRGNWTWFIARARFISIARRCRSHFISTPRFCAALLHGRCTVLTTRLPSRHRSTAVELVRSSRRRNLRPSLIH